MGKELDCSFFGCMYFQIEFEWQHRAVLNYLICNLVNDIGVFWFCHKRKGNLIPGPEKNQNLEKIDQV